MVASFRPYSTFALLLGALLVTGCNTSQHAEKKSAEPIPGYDPTISARDTVKAREENSVLIAQVVTQVGAEKGEDVRYEVKQSVLAEKFIHEFGDGTVVDKVMVTPVRDDPKAKAYYYLVGMGQLKGQFRAMAIALEASQEKGLYLKPKAARYIAEGTTCPMCYFSFSRGKVTGVDCSESSTGTAERRCSYRVEQGNGFYPQARKQEPMSKGK